VSGKSRDRCFSDRGKLLLLEEGEVRPSRLLDVTANKQGRSGESATDDVSRCNGSSDKGTAAESHTADSKSSKSEDVLVSETTKVSTRRNRDRRNSTLSHREKLRRTPRFKAPVRGQSSCHR